MAIDINKVSLQVFNTIKGFGNNIQMFKETGEPAFDPESEARKYYIKNSGAMVTLDDDGHHNYILKVIINKNNDFDANKKLLQTLRSLATSYGLEFSSRVFDHDIEPKDFAYQAHAANIKEHCEPQLDKSTTKIVLKHVTGVEPTSNKRTTKQQIFIEDAVGQRVLFPITNMNGARAMARHIANNGELGDEFGKYILRISEEYEHLKTVKRASKKLNEKDVNIVTCVNDNMANISKLLQMLQTQTGYIKHGKVIPIEIDASDDDLMEVANDIASRCQYTKENKKPFIVIARMMLNTPTVNNTQITESFVHWIDNKINSLTTSKYNV